MTMTRLIRKDINSTQEDLIKWALDNGYSPVTSYTKAPVANRFYVWLENNGKFAPAVFCLSSEAFLWKTLVSM